MLGLRRARRGAAPLLSALLVVALLVGGCSAEETPAVEAPSSAETSADATTSAVETLIGQGLGEVESGDLEAARGTFGTVLRLEPGNVFGHYNLGYIAQQEGDLATAIQEYGNAIGVDPDFAPALYNLAILTEEADLRTAVDLYRRVLEVREDDAATHVRLGFALQHLGEQEEGQEMLDRGIELDPAMAEVEPPAYRDR